MRDRVIVIAALTGYGLGVLAGAGFAGGPHWIGWAAVIATNLLGVGFWITR